MTFDPSGVNEPPEKRSYMPPWTRSVSVPSEFSTTRSSGPGNERSPRLMSSFEPSLDHARGSPGRSLSWIRSAGVPPDVGFTAQIPSSFPYAIQPPTSERIPNSLASDAGEGVGDVTGDGSPDAAVVGFDVGAPTDASFEHEDAPRRRMAAASTHGINASTPTSRTFLMAPSPTARHQVCRFGGDASAGGADPL